MSLIRRDHLEIAEGRKFQIWQEVDSKMSWYCRCGDRFYRRQSEKKTQKNLPYRLIFHFQILDETECISHSTNTLGKGMNPIILPLAMDK